METNLDTNKNNSHTNSKSHDNVSDEKHGRINSGYRVRVDVHAGIWWCNSCEGKTEGNQLIQPSCEYCQVG